MKARNTSRSGEAENLLLALRIAGMGHTRKKKKGHKKRTSRKDKPDNEVPTSSSSARQHEARDDEASASDSDSDYANNLDLIQVNLKRSPAHVIAIQDPPPEFAWKSCPGYNIEYLPARELLENDNPKTTEDPVPVKLVGFYVTQSIGPSDWRIDWREHDNDHYGSVASMFLNTSCGKITIHNVYNNNQSIFMSILLTDSDHPVNGESAVMVGDFNLHHPGWGGDRVAQVEKDAEILHQAISMAGMRCLLPPGLRSYSRSATDSGDFSTTIDLAFAGQRLQSRAHPTRALSVPGFDSDHRPLHTRISVAPNRDKEPRCNWDKENEKKYCKEVKQQFLTIGCPTIGTAAEVDDYAKALVLGIYEAARRTIPCYRKTAPRPKPEVVPEDVQRARENEENQLRILHELRCRRKQRVQEEKCRIAKRETRYATKMHKLASFRENIASQASQLRGLHQLARQVPLWSQLQRQVHLKRLIRPDGSVCQTDDESLHCFKDKIWPKTSDASDPPAPEIPKLDPKRPQLFTPQCISDDELHDAFTSVERGKAAGPDDIISNALKVGWAEIYKYFKHLVNASFKMFHHFLCFRDATTIVFPKPDKEDYAQPKAYRPIALLSCIGKLLERLMAARLQLLAVQHKFLPNRQFACVGRSTTEALERVLQRHAAGRVALQPRRR